MKALPIVAIARFLCFPGPARAHMTKECLLAIVQHDTAIATVFVAAHQKDKHGDKSALFQKFMKEMEQRTREVQRACLEQQPRQPDSDRRR